MCGCGAAPRLGQDLGWPPLCAELGWSQTQGRGAREADIFSEVSASPPRTWLVSNEVTGPSSVQAWSPRGLGHMGCV